jgi:hypothetical protein
MREVLKNVKRRYAVERGRRKEHVFQETVQNIYALGPKRSMRRLNRLQGHFSVFVAKGCEERSIVRTNIQNLAAGRHVSADYLSRKRVRTPFAGRPPQSGGWPG